MIWALNHDRSASALKSQELNYGFFFPTCLLFFLFFVSTGFLPDWSIHLLFFHSFSVFCFLFPLAFCHTGLITHILTQSYATSTITNSQTETTSTVAKQLHTRKAPQYSGPKILAEVEEEEGEEEVMTISIVNQRSVINQQSSRPSSWLCDPA